MENYPEIRTDVSEIGRYGAAVLSVTAEEFHAAGLAPGDLFAIRIKDKDFTAPFGTAYSDVDSGNLILLKIVLESRLILAMNNEAGFCEKNGIVIGDSVSISLLKKEGYLAEYNLRSVLMSSEREDYASDEVFANFRSVSAGNIRKDTLYRGFSPINPADHRNETADRLLSKTKVKTAINLDNEDIDARRKYEGYEESHYSTLTIIPVKMSFSPEEASFPDGIRAILLAISENEAPYYIHCRYSRDRTGLACAILEALCGASLAEITADYMLSYENIHHLVRGSEKWNFQAEQHVKKVLENLLGLPDLGSLPKEELREVVASMLTERFGISENVISSVQKKLCEGKKMESKVIYETENFKIILPGMPHIPREDGGHIYITSKEHYTDRTEFPPALMVEMARLSQAAGRAFTAALQKGGVNVARINYQENGNWAFRNGNTYPPFFHLHLYGRTEDSKTQEWGQALNFPDPDTGYYDGFCGLTEEDVTNFTEELTKLLASPEFSEDNFRM